MSGDEVAVEPRHLSLLLLLGLLVAPGVFVWFLLRRGYANSTRVAAFVYTGVMLAFGIFRANL